MNSHNFAATQQPAQNHQNHGDARPGHHAATKTNSARTATPPKQSISIMAMPWEEEGMVQIGEWRGKRW